MFNPQEYLDFLQWQIAPRYRRKGGILVREQDTCLKDKAVWTWFHPSRNWLEVKRLPHYFPQFDRTERLWPHTRKNATHNRSFLPVDEL